jgi:poly(beta-D-mannuronate) lyase
VRKPSLLVLLLVFASVSSADAKETLVKNVAEFDAAVKAAQPGDAIVLADGEWRDAELKFRADGRAMKEPALFVSDGVPVVLRAETPGQVVFTGKSRLRLGGTFLSVRGLLWKNPTAEDHVVAFRVDSKTPASHSELRECAIIDDSTTTDGRERKWVSLYGRQNIVMSCRFEGKRDRGATLVAWISPDSGDHRLALNFFGPRPVLGKNGGETIRIGTSDVSMLEGKVITYRNYFAGCAGEAEIISNKSSRNTYLENVFVGCGGALTLRHGNNCLVVLNRFFGNGVKGTGGVRVTGERHRIAGNWFVGLLGDDARAAVSLMNGVPDSPLNEYFQVKQVELRANILFRCKQNIVVGLRDDDNKRQTLPPRECSFTINTVIAEDGTVFDVRAEAIDFRYDANDYRAKSLGLDPNPGWRDDSPLWEEEFASLEAFQAFSKALKMAPMILPSEVGPPWLRPGDEFLPRIFQKK